MNDILHFLQQRNSAPKLTAPAPTGDDLKQIFNAALRAPDHARLRPWRFLTITGSRRKALGEVLRDGLLRRNPLADEVACSKVLASPLRAPLIVVAIARFSEHPKVPKIEQQLSAGCAAHAILLAAQATGFAGIWRTGNSAFDRGVMTDLGLAGNEEIVGFLYLGSRDGAAKPLPQLDTDDFVSNW